MKDFSMMSNEERQQIRQQHSKLYDGYSVGNVPSNMTPLTVYDAARDKEGITMGSNGEIKTYRNHKINEIAAKNLHYDEIDPAYEFDSNGPGDENLGYNVYNQTKPPYDFDSKGPSDPYYGGGGQPGEEESPKEEFDFDMIDFEDYIDGEESDNIKECVSKTLNMFKKIKNYN